MTEPWDLMAFQILAEEIPGTPPERAAGLIRRKLRRSGLGAYDEVRVGDLRRLRDELEREILKFDRSQYFKPTGATMAAMDDFDLDGMARDYSRSYPQIDGAALRGIIGFALYYYYLR